MSLRTNSRRYNFIRKRQLLKNAMCVFAVAFFACVMTGVLSGISVVASMKKTDAFSIEVEYGYGSIVQQKCNMPIRIGFTEITRDFNGMIEFVVPTEKDDYILFREELHLTKGVEEKLHYSVPIIPNASEIRIDISEGVGEILFEHIISLRAEEVGQYVTVAAMNKEQKALSYLNGEEFSSLNGWSVRTFWLNGKEFPQNYQELDMVDILVTRQEDVERLSEEQKEALRMWIKRGGCLLYSNSETEIETASGTETDYMTVFPDEEPVLFWRTNYVDGAVAGVGANLFDTERIDSRISENILNVLTKAVEMDNWLNPSLYSMEGFDKDSWCSEALYELNGYGSSRPTIAMYLLVILVYICIVLPFIFWILKRLDKQHYLREILFAAAFFFAGIIFLAGARTRFTVPTLGYVRVLDYTKEQISDEVYLSVQLPYQQDISVRFSPEYQTSPLCFGQEHNLNFDLLGRTDWYRYQLYRSQAASELLMGNSYAVTPLYFRLSEIKENEELYGIYGNLSFEEGQVSGKLENRTGREFLFAVIVKEGQLAVLNDTEIDDTEVAESTESFDLSEREELLERLREWITPYPGKEALQSSAIYAIVDYALARTKDSGQAWFIGVNVPTETDFIKDGTGWEISGVNIVLSPVYENGQ